MEILAGILCFLQIVDIALSVKDRYKHIVNKEAISELLINIGQTLYSVADDLDNGQYPHGKCMQMWEYLNGFSEQVKGKIKDDQYQRLLELLNKSYQVEKLCGELTQLSVDQKKKNVLKLRMAAGSFVAVGEMIKV